MGCHIFNAMYRGLELTAPRKVRSKTRTPNQHNWTTNERVEYLFPATRHTDGNLTVNWVSGRERPPKALTAAIPESIKYRFGCVLKGEAGLLVLRHGNSPILLPTKKSSDVTLPELNPIGHHDAFVNAVLKGEQKGLLFSHRICSGSHRVHPARQHRHAALAPLARMGRHEGHHP